MNCKFTFHFLKKNVMDCKFTFTFLHLKKEINLFKNNFKNQTRSIVSSHFTKLFSQYIRNSENVTTCKFTLLFQHFHNTKTVATRHIFHLIFRLFHVISLSHCMQIRQCLPRNSITRSIRESQLFRQLRSVST